MFTKLRTFGGNPGQFDEKFKFSTKLIDPYFTQFDYFCEQKCIAIMTFQIHMFFINGMLIIKACFVVYIKFTKLRAFGGNPGKFDKNIKFSTELMDPYFT